MKRILLFLFILILMTSSFMSCLKITAKNKNPGNMYGEALHGFMLFEPMMNSNMKYIAVDFNDINNIKDTDKKLITSFLNNKHKVEVTYKSLAELEKTGFYDKEKNYLDGVLLSITETKKLSDNNYEIYGTKFRSGSKIPNIKCTIEYVNGKWSTSCKEIDPTKS